MYIAGTLGLADIGIPNDRPRIVCDKCGVVHYLVLLTDEEPPDWFFKGFAPDGWRTKQAKDGERVDYCFMCK